MSTPDIDRFTGRPFSFYPPILNVEHNQWVYVESTWSEMKVRNTGSAEELWIPRRYVGEVSQVDDPVMIVGLNHELSHKGGIVTPHRRTLLSMPRTTHIPAPLSPALSAPPPRSKPRRTESATEKSVGRLIMIALVVAISATFLTVMLTRDRHAGGRVSYEAVLQAELGLSAADDYFAVVRKLGEPRNDRWRSESGEQQYRALDYPDLGVTVLLMGADRDRVFYIGAKDEEWRNVHTVKLPGDSNTDSILRSLERF